jgi:hypothetical protein
MFQQVVKALVNASHSLLNLLINCLLDLKLSRYNWIWSAIRSDAPWQLGFVFTTLHNFWKGPISKCSSLTSLSNLVKCNIIRPICKLQRKWSAMNTVPDSNSDFLTLYNSSIKLSLASIVSYYLEEYQENNSDSKTLTLRKYCHLLRGLQIRLYR